ncbi:hypothetical protein [Nocardia barduliensis]|uniref:hypothetical protein n=1 Tax=Nocardia barduliensis TaxID=2736643 RepID=UPI0015735421|nr:hypothetical protein [Nocardia barduliensis]
MDAKRNDRKVVDPGRFDPDTPKRRISQQSHQWLLTRIQTPVVRERATTLRTVTATVALMLVAAVALAGSIVAIAYALPLINEFSDGCKKLSERDVIGALGAGTTVGSFDYEPPPSAAPAPNTASNVLAEGDICARSVSGWKDGDRVRSSIMFARTQTGSDATAVFRREREKALTRDPQDTGTLRTFFLNDTRLGDEAFCTVTKNAYHPAHGVLVRFGDKVVYVDVPTVSILTDRENCDRARRLANELR